MLVARLALALADQLAAACSSTPIASQRLERSLPRRPALPHNRVMPLFEYTCKDCDRQFEFLVRAQETPACPTCHGTELQRRMSTFAAHTAGSSAASGSSAAAMSSVGGCGSCGDPRGPGACSMN
jgi:putative FmdB family regulatory protein